MRTVLRSPASIIESDWSFTASSASWRVAARRLQQRRTARLPAPEYDVIRQPGAHPRWNLLFLFIPSGALDPMQNELLRRCRQLTGQLMVVFAAPGGVDVPAQLAVADAIVRKDLNGFDMSGYAIGLQLIARHSPGADAYVQNDSIIGPLADIDETIGSARWDLTGFMASAAVEHHISSFAFVLKNVTLERVASLSDVLSTVWCYNDFSPVVLSQETRLARVAHETMSVGALFYLGARPAPISAGQRLATWFGAIDNRPLDLRGDATLGTPLSLLDLGFPFLKRSLFGKFAGVAERSTLLDRLAALGWPDDAMPS